MLVNFWNLVILSSARCRHVLVVELHLSIICCKQMCGKDLTLFYMHLAFCLCSYLVVASWRVTVVIRWKVNYVPAAISITMNKTPQAFDTTRKVAQFEIFVLIFPLALFLVTNVACVQVHMCFLLSCVIFIDSRPCCGQRRMFCDWF
jgi:hypothetical protein